MPYVLNIDEGRMFEKTKRDTNELQRKSKSLS
jgi:hypothetical protein